MLLRRGLALLACAALATAPTSAQPPRPSTAKPSLYYFVVDRSGSIKTNELVVPMRGALIQKLGEVPENAEVRLVLFNERADRRGAWGPMTTNARGELSKWFDENFRPQGDTRLYDTVGEALTEISGLRARYSLVQLIVLSDGIEDPPVSRRYRAWRDLEPLTRELKRSEPPFFGTWYTLGFAPRERPAEGSGIDVTAVPDPRQGFSIAIALPPLKADFEYAPSVIYANEPLRLIDTSEGMPDSWEWTLPGGATQTSPRPEVVLSEPGSFPIALTVKRDSATDTVTKAVTVESPLAKADFRVSRKSGTVPFEVVFEDASRGDNVSYAWDFGDGGTSDLRNPRHTYRNPGSYTPRLTVTHSKGGLVRSTGDVVINAGAPVPLWARVLAVLVALVLVWVLLVVPRVLKPTILPHVGVAFRGLQTHDLRRLCRRYRWAWLWPRGDVPIGSRNSDFIRVGTGNRGWATIRRHAGTQSYVLVPLDETSVKAVKVNDVLGREARTTMPVTRTVALKDGDQFQIQQESFVWVQPGLKGRK